MNDERNPAEKGAAHRAKRKDTIVRRYHEIYKHTDLIRAIQQLKGDRTEPTGRDDDPWRVEADAAALTLEDANRLRKLVEIAAEPSGHRRLSIVGCQSMIRRLEALSFAMPHFAPAIDLVARSALVSARTMTPLRLPPILLLGDPGIGKSYTLHRLAEAIGADFSMIAANLIDAFRLRGLNTAYRGARMGRVAEILLGATTTPVVLVDEFDKAIGDKTERPYDVWHSLLERENAQRFKDDFLELELRADQIIWFASANDLSVFPSSILDRLLVLKIPPPDQVQLGIIVASIYSACRKAYGETLPERLSEEVASELLRYIPRRISRLLDLAVGYAAASGRRRLSVDDIRCADRLAGTARSDRISFRGPVGFLQGRLS